MSCQTLLCIFATPLLILSFCWPTSADDIFEQKGSSKVCLGAICKFRILDKDPFESKTSLIALKCKSFLHLCGFRFLTFLSHLHLLLMGTFNVRILQNSFLSSETFSDFDMFNLLRGRFEPKC